MAFGWFVAIYMYNRPELVTGLQVSWTGCSPLCVWSDCVMRRVAVAGQINVQAQKRGRRWLCWPDSAPDVLAACCRQVVEALFARHTHNNSSRHCASCKAKQMHKNLPIILVDLAT